MIVIFLCFPKKFLRNNVTILLDFPDNYLILFIGSIQFYVYFVETYTKNKHSSKKII